jgi:putative DNA primase/helicase
MNNISLIHDGKLTIAVGKSRRETKWKNMNLKWSELLSKFSTTMRTTETLEEYKNLPKGDQDEIKDNGGFVGGVLREEKRRRDTVFERCLITLDADFAKPGFWEDISEKFDFACCIYSTHKHTPDKPRLRLVIPLSRPVSPEEYEAISRRLAADLGIDYFDSTTFEASRLMYWPSTSRDGAFKFEHKDAEWLNPNKVLERYEDWRDMLSWPQPQGAEKERKASGVKQGNPREKKGLVGAFCRTYSVTQAIEKFLKGIYKPLGKGDRYTYTRGSTSGGLVIYENGDFAYSNHATDPAGGRLCNSFDLVRLHKFSELDEKSKPETPIAQLPSYKAMIEFCSEDEEVKLTLGAERLRAVASDFREISEGASGDDWYKLLEFDKEGRVKATTTNIVHILENDPNLKGKIAYNDFSHRTMIKASIPWHEVENEAVGEDWAESDDPELRVYLEGTYGISSLRKISDSLVSVQNKNRYHPIRDYLSKTDWDGTPRLETIFIDYLGAEDTPYIRTVTRKTLTAAVARVFEPGIKFDYMLILTGTQGIGKSKLMSRLGQGWFSDSLTSLMGKESYEQVHAAWIIEVSELLALKGAEAERAKAFISKQVDTWRVAYGKRTESFKRQCVFFGTTNETEFLKDVTGNRKFWPVKVALNTPTKDLETDLTQSEIDQIWAEACEYYKRGELLYLDPEMEKEAKEMQEMHMQSNAKEGMIMEYLEMLLPEGWENMDLQARKRFIKGTEFGTPRGTVKRAKVCAVEIFMELFDGESRFVNPSISREINDILRNIKEWKPYSKGKGKLRFGRFYGPQTAFIREGSEYDERQACL